MSRTTYTMRCVLVSYVIIMRSLKTWSFICTHNQAYYLLPLDVFYVRDLQAIPGGQFGPWR
jgi:hypothetical protein